MASSAPTSTVAPGGGSSGDPVVVAVGDIAHASGCAPCAADCDCGVRTELSPERRFRPRRQPVRVRLCSEYSAGPTTSHGGSDFNSIVHPVPGNHEYLTSGAAGYFQYFGDNGVTTGSPGGYYSFNLGNWHIVALNSNCSDSGCSDALDGQATTSAADVVAADRSGGEPERVRARDVAPPAVLRRVDARRPGRAATVDRAVQRPRGRGAQRARPPVRALRAGGSVRNANTNGIASSSWEPAARA